MAARPLADEAADVMRQAARPRVLFAPTWLGDATMSLPVLRAIRRFRPEEPLIVFARRGPAALYRMEGSATEVVVSTGRFLEDWRRLRRIRPGEVWMLAPSFGAALLSLLAGATERIGYATDGRGFLLTHALPRASGTWHQREAYSRLLESRGIPADSGPPRLPIHPDAARRASEALEKAGLAAAGPLAFLAPGSATSSIKRWPAEYYGQLGTALVERGFACAVVIGPGERDVGNLVSGSASPHLPVLGEDLDPAELAALLARAAVVICNDSGVMHVAAAAGTPVAAFFGPTDPGATSPAGAPLRILDRYIFCSPCHLKQCPYALECLRGITVADALRAVDELLGDARPVASGMSF